MITKLSRAIAFSVSLTLALTPASRVANACGGYGAQDFERFSARNVALQAASSLQARDRAAALALFTADARASHEYNGCCMPPTWSPAEWMTMRFADRTWRVGTLSRLERSPDGRTFVAHFSDGTINSTPSTHIFTMSLDGENWKISRVYTARAARAA